MKVQNSLEVKFVKFSKAQLEAKLETEQDPETKQAIQNILDRRNGVKKEEPKKEEPAKDAAAPVDGKKVAKAVSEAGKAKDAKEVKTEKEPKSKKEKEEKKSKRISEGFVPVIESKDKAVQKMISDLPTATGKDLENLKADLQVQGIDVPWISFLSKGDQVEFDAAKNSPLAGTKLKGIVTGISDTDKSGRKYCKVKVEGKGTFQKAQSSVFKIANNEVSEK